MLNFKKNDRERCILQKRTISINEFVQFDKAVINRNKYFSIEENQDDLNENDHNDQLKDFEQCNINQIVRDQIYDNFNISQSRKFIISVFKYCCESR